LHIAAQRGHLNVIETFINYKNIFTNKKNHCWDNEINFNARKKHPKNLGVTPAFLAAKNGHDEIFKLLHENGALIEGVQCSMKD